MVVMGVLSSLRFAFVLVFTLVCLLLRFVWVILVCGLWALIFGFWVCWLFWVALGLYLVRLTAGFGQDSVFADGVCCCLGCLMVLVLECCCWLLSLGCLWLFWCCRLIRFVTYGYDILVCGLLF